MVSLMKNKSYKVSQLTKLFKYPAKVDFYYFDQAVYNYKVKG